MKKTPELFIKVENKEEIIKKNIQGTERRKNKIIINWSFLFFFYTARKSETLVFREIL